MEFEKLRKENADIVAWIRFDDPDEMGIDYPVLYSGDNETYLRKNLHGKIHIAASIFLEGLNQPDFFFFFNILIGYQPGEEYQKLIDHMVNNSSIQTGITPQSSDKILTLSTCTGQGYEKRFAIHAVCVDTQSADVK